MKNSEKKRIRKQILSAGISAAMFAGMIGSISVVAGETTASDSAVKYQITDSGYGFQVVTQIDGATLSYSESSGVILLEQDGYAFKDLNRNGVLDTYEDWREDDETRAQALASLLMSDGEEGLHTALGLLYHPSARMESTATEESALYDYVVNQKNTPYSLLLYGRKQSDLNRDGKQRRSVHRRITGIWHPDQLQL